MKQENEKQILVIKHGALGDLMQSMGLLKDIKFRYPESVITILTSPSYYQLMHRCPFIDKIIIDKRAPFWRLDEQLKLQKKLHHQHFDLVIDLQNSNRSRVYRKLWLAKSQWIGRNAQEAAPISGLSGLIELLKNAGIPVQFAFNADLSWMIGDVDTILKQHGISQEYIALIPGSSSQHANKRWPYYSALAKAFIDYGHQVVVILGPDETNIGNQMPGHLIKGLNWFELAGVLNRAKFVVGNDTGPSHIASYLNKAGLAIFGPTTTAARSEIGHRHFKTIDVDNLASLTAEHVFTYVQEQLR